MALYNCLDRSTVEGLTRRFGIGDITDVSVIDGGAENTSYRVETSSGRYVLTICDQQSLKEVTNLANLLVYLTDHGIRTSRVVVPPKEREPTRSVGRGSGSVACDSCAFLPASIVSLWP